MLSFSTMFAPDDIVAAPSPIRPASPSSRSRCISPVPIEAKDWTGDDLDTTADRTLPLHSEPPRVDDTPHEMEDPSSSPSPLAAPNQALASKDDAASVVITGDLPERPFALTATT